MPSTPKQHKALISGLTFCLLILVLVAVAVGGHRDLDASVGAAQEVTNSGPAFPTEEECVEYAAGAPIPTAVSPGEEGQTIEGCLVVMPAQEPVEVGQGVQVLVDEDEASGLICAEIRQGANTGNACTHADEQDPMVFVSSTGPAAAEIPADMVVVDPQKRLGSVQLFSGPDVIDAFSDPQDDGLWIYGHLPDRYIEIVDGVIITDVNENFISAPEISFENSIRLAQEEAEKVKEAELAAEP